MRLLNNQGMYAEEIINRTCDFLIHNDEELSIEKRNIPIKIIQKINQNTVMAKLLSKSTVDYFGFFNTTYFEFEVKQTSNTYFDINLLKEHQIDTLKKDIKRNIQSFVLIFFDKYEKFFILNSEDLFSSKSKKINFNFFEKNCDEIEIIYPGILDIKILKNWLLKNSDKYN